MKPMDIAVQARKYTQHDMIETYVQLPSFPNHRSRLLYTFLNKESRLQHSELYTLVTSLVQMGLDTHDKIEVSGNSQVKRGDRTRQLTVLAGDYFSGRFYQLLAQAGQIETIKRLSSAICDVNRMKLNLYMKMKQMKCTAEEYLMQTVLIKSQLYLSFNHWIDHQERSLWNELLSSFTSLEIISEELKRVNEHRAFKDSLAYWFMLQEATVEDKPFILNSDKLDSSRFIAFLDKYQIIKNITHMLGNQVNQVQLLIEQRVPGSLSTELNDLLQPFKQMINSNRLAKERS